MRVTDVKVPQPHTSRALVGTPETITVGLDRAPQLKEEDELVGGFREVATLDEIWVRDKQAPYDPHALPWEQDAKPVMAVYLSFSVMDAESRRLADRIEDAFKIRNMFSMYDFAFFHIFVGEIPLDLPARIWQRPKTVWVPK
jgi:hypothetical protein